MMLQWRAWVEPLPVMLKEWNKFIVDAQIHEDPGNTLYDCIETARFSEYPDSHYDSYQIRNDLDDDLPSLLGSFDEGIKYMHFFEESANDEGTDD